LTIQIGPLAALLIALGLAVGVIVFKYTSSGHTTAPTPGGPVGAIASGALIYEEDLTYKAVGAKLGGMTSRAVEGHLRRLREKLDPSLPKRRHRGRGPGKASRRAEEPLLFGGEGR
jgi:hypothetical protein